MTADEIWDQGAAALRAQLAPATWAAWFHGVRPVEFATTCSMLSVPSSLAAERIRSSYSGMLTDAIRDDTGRPSARADRRDRRPRRASPLATHVAAVDDPDRAARRRRCPLGAPSERRARRGRATRPGRRAR